MDISNGQKRRVFLFFDLMVTHAAPTGFHVDHWDPKSEHMETTRVQVVPLWIAWVTIKSLGRAARGSGRFRADPRDPKRTHLNSCGLHVRSKNPKRTPVVITMVNMLITMINLGPLRDHMDPT